MGHREEGVTGQAILGIINILGENFLLIVTRSDIVGVIEHSKIYKITDSMFIPFSKRDVSSFTTEIKKFMGEIRKVRPWVIIVVIKPKLLLQLPL